MKQAEDNKTVDIEDAPGVRRQRGRPAVSNLTPKEQAAERQRRRRAKLAESDMVPLSVNVPREVKEALEKFIQFKDITLEQVVEKAIRQAIMRKR